LRRSSSVGWATVVTQSRGRGSDHHRDRETAEAERFEAGDEGRYAQERGRCIAFSGIDDFLNTVSATWHLRDRDQGHR
jgi:hypothetical protein